jgi:MFS family permease
VRLATASDAPPKAARRGGTFSALRYRNFRLLWTGTLFSQGGDWLDQVALNWYVISTTGNPVLLGVINLARGVPLALFAMVGGAVADRVDRRRMMMVTQTLAMICAVAMYLLVAGGDPPILLLLAMTTLRGMLVAFNTPARQALLPATVPVTELGSAVALHSVVLNTAKVLGPLTAAAILALWGVAACFLANAVTFVVLLVQLWLMRLPPAPARTGPREPLWR